MKTCLTIPSRKPACLVEHVMVMLFHDIAAIFLTFTIVSWITDRMLAFLNSRRVRRQGRRIRRNLVYIFGIVCGRVALAIIKGLKIFGYVLAKVQDALRGLVLYVAEGNLVVVKLCLAVGDMDVEVGDEDYGKKTKKEEVKEGASHSSAVVEAAVKPALKVTFKPALKPTVKPTIKTRSTARLRVETSLEDNPNRNWSNEHGNLSPQRLRVKTSLEDNSNRNWSNEHGNLSPGSSPTARSTSSIHTVRPIHCAADLTRPLRCERPDSSRMKSLARPGPSGSSSLIPRSVLYMPKGSERTSSEPPIMSSAYREYWRTRAHLDYRGALLGPYPSDAASVSTFGESVVRTPSTSTSSDGGIDTPCASSNSSGGVHTPSPTRSSDSGDSLGRGVQAPTSTSSPESEVTAIHTPPSAGSPDSGDSSRPSTPDSASPSDSNETVIRTPSPEFTSCRLSHGF
jgi:hypothetical protein